MNQTANTRFKKRSGPMKALSHALALLGMLALTWFVLIPYLERFERLPGESTIQSIQLPEDPENIQYSISRIETDGRSAVEVEGFAFIDGEDAVGQETYIVLKSEDRVCVFDAPARRIPGLAKQFKDKNLDLDLAGFQALLPARMIGNREYQVGILVKKGEREGLDFTSTTIIKAHGFVYTVAQSAIVDMDLPGETENVVCAIEPIEDIGRTYRHISGWAFIEGYDTKDNEIYLVLQSERRTYVLETIRKTKKDPMRSFGDKNLNLEDSGFEVFIDLAERRGSLIGDGEYRVGIYIRKGETQAFSYTDTVLRKTGYILARIIHEN